jgi:3-hydroxybutyryl-CoA dehydrogenase
MESPIVAVIGAGTIGIDVALDLAFHDYSVLLKELSNEILDRAREGIQNRYRFMKLMAGKRSLPPIDAVLERIKLTADYSEFKSAEIVVENITEDYEAKAQVYAELAEACSDSAIYGVNTSCLPITQIAALLPRPANVIGTHFMNPVPLSKVVEVIRGHHTSQATVESMKRFIKALGKTAVVVNDSPGFVTNRVMMPMINEAIWTLHDQVADAKAVDTIFRLGFGHKMGPLATADLIGLDTILQSLLVLYESFNDSKYRPCPLLRKMVAAGLLGRKSGEGFFKY